MTATRRSFRRERMRSLEFDPTPGREIAELGRTPIVWPPRSRGRASRHKTVRELYELQEGCCFHCRKTMPPTVTRRLENGRYDDGWTREHVVPRVSGGRNGRNIVLSCRGCNAQKGYRMPTRHELEVANALHDSVPLRRFPKENQ